MRMNGDGGIWAMQPSTNPLSRWSAVEADLTRSTQLEEVANA